MLTTLGVAIAGDVGVTIYNGHAIEPSAVMIRYTWLGDANLDGIIDGDDYFQLDDHVGQSGSSIGYYEGDLNYSGNVDADDYWLIDANYSKAQAQPAAPLAGAELPQTASLLGELKKNDDLDLIA
jgi:hypothetical protein